MSDEPTIQPAMMPEQWAEVVADDIPNDDSGRWTWIDQYDPDAVSPFHAVAAIALYQQLFGFTHADVKALLYTLDDVQKCGTDGQLKSIAARIAALLPPTP